MSEDLIERHIMIVMNRTKRYLRKVEREGIPLKGVPGHIRAKLKLLESLAEQSTGVASHA